MSLGLCLSKVHSGVALLAVQLCSRVPMLSVGPLHGPLHLQQVFKLCVDHRWPTFNIQIPEKAEPTLEVNWGRGSQPQGISCFSMGHSLTQSQGESQTSLLVWENASSLLTVKRENVRLRAATVFWTSLESVLDTQQSMKEAEPPCSQ